MGHPGQPLRGASSRIRSAPGNHQELAERRHRSCGGQNRNEPARSVYSRHSKSDVDHPPICIQHRLVHRFADSSDAGTPCRISSASVLSSVRAMV